MGSINVNRKAMVMSILLLSSLLATSGYVAAQGQCPPPIPMPTVDSRGNEVQNLWKDIRVQEAQAFLCHTPPGDGQALGIIDLEFGEGAHGAYTSQIAAGNADGTGHGYGPGEFPGIAAGASMVEESFNEVLADFYKMCLEETPSIPIFSTIFCQIRTILSSADLVTSAFLHAAAQTGPDRAIGFPMTLEENWWLRANLPSVRHMLNTFGSYADTEIVVLPANFLPTNVANLRRTQRWIENSRTLVVHQIRRERMEFDNDCVFPNSQCATMPYAIDLVVPTTNGNNSIVVPAVLAAIALMKNANPSLTSEQIMAILTEPSNFTRAVTVGDRTVPVLDLFEAVKAARAFGSTQIGVSILQGSDDAGPDPGLGCNDFTDRNEVYFAKCLDGQTDLTSGFRFSNLSIPQGVKILDAHIEFTVDGPYDNQVQLEIIGEKNTLPDTFGPGRWPSQRLHLTNTSVAWIVPSSDFWNFTETRTTPNLSEILQEIVSLETWNLTNNGVGILIRNAGPAEIGPNGEYHRRVFAFERDATRAARLIVHFVKTTQ